MHPGDFVETVGAFTVELTHMFVPVKSLAAAVTLTTVADDTINDTHHSDGHNLFFFFFFFFFDLTKSLERTVGVLHVEPGRFETESPCCVKVRTRKPVLHLRKAINRICKIDGGLKARVVRLIDGGLKARVV